MSEDQLASALVAAPFVLIGFLHCLGATVFAVIDAKAERKVRRHD